MAISTNFVSALGGGSGIDIKALAQNLVDVEKVPQENRINKKIKESESRITGYDALKFALTKLKSAFQALDDAREFNSISATSSQNSAVTVNADNSASPATYQVEITQIAKPQRMQSLAYPSKTDALSASSPIVLRWQSGDDEFDINVTDTSLEGIAAAINQSKDDTGLNARIINTGSGFQLLISGATGENHSFSLSASALEPITVTSGFQSDQDGKFIKASADPKANSVVLHYTSQSDGNGSMNLVRNNQGDWVLPEPNTLPADAESFSTSASRGFMTLMESAQNAQLKIDGIDVESDTNQLTDAVDGVTFNIYSTTVSAAKIELARESEKIKSSLENIVTAYNELAESVKVLQDPKSKVETYGGVLAGDTLTRRLFSQVRAFFIDDAQPAETNIKAARDVGLSLDRYGKLSLDSDKLNESLALHFDEVVKVFTANKNDKSLYVKTNAGLAGAAVSSIDAMLRSTSLIDAQAINEQNKIDAYKVQLEDLQIKMNALLERYINQFAVMDSIVGQSNSIRSSLKNSLNGLNNNNNGF